MVYGGYLDVLSVIIKKPCSDFRKEKRERCVCVFMYTWRPENVFLSLSTIIFEKGSLYQPRPRYLARLTGPVSSRDLTCPAPHPQRQVTGVPRLGFCANAGV